MPTRREVLKVGGGLLLSGGLLGSLLADDRIRAVEAGWVYVQADTRKFIRTNPKPFFAQQSSAIKGTGRDKQILLWKYLEAVTKQAYVPKAQEIGDCVSEGAATGVDLLTAVQIALLKRNEEWKGEACTETIYAGGRVEVGKSKIGRFDGMMGAWAGEWVRDYGVLLRGQYGDIDLTKYRPDLARLWGRPKAGVPDDLEAISKPHPVKTVTIVTNWEDCCDSIANGYPVLVCSNVGYRSTFDSDGFLNRGRKPWNHSMVIGGIDTKSKREGGCIFNSWGESWADGPQHKLGTPAGCFWADAKNIDAMLSQEDSFAFSNYVGYPRRQLDYRLW